MLNDPKCYEKLFLDDFYSKKCKIINEVSTTPELSNGVIFHDVFTASIQVHHNSGIIGFPSEQKQHSTLISNVMSSAAFVANYISRGANTPENSREV